jgi:predicted DNA-binding protein YlxM (UPF0122 family)
MSIRQVHQYSLDGTFIKSHNSLADAFKDTGISKQSISNCLQKISKSAGKFLWSYTKLDSVDEYTLDYHKIPVYQYSLDGKFMAEFSSMADAAEKTGVDSRYISDNVNGRYQSAGKFIWKKEKSETVDNYVEKINYNVKEVHQYDLDENYIASYVSQAEAARITNTDKQGISNCITGKAKTANKYIWTNIKK